MIKIGIVDDEVLFRKGLRQLIADFEDIEVILEAGDGDELLGQIAHAEELPDILLLDLKMPKVNGIEVTKLLQEQFPSIKIIVLSTYFSKAFILNMIELGAAAYLPKNSLPSEVENSIREVSAKGFAYNDQVLTVIRENMMKKQKPKMPSTFQTVLTTREKEILQLICEEFTTGEIAEQLFISPRTVDGHRNNLLQKLDCRNTAGLVVYAIQHQLVSIAPDTFWNKKRSDASR